MGYLWEMVSAQVPAANTATDCVTIVGAGIAGAACAVVLRRAGMQFRLVDRGRAPGGRMASPVLHGRRVDIGASYFTVRDDRFAATVQGWASAGLAREWTDTFAVVASDKPLETRRGPMRWAAPGGLRALVLALLDGTEVQAGVAVDSLPPGDVVVAMPDPQAARLVSVPDAVAYDPAIAVVCGFIDRQWEFADAAFVQDHPDIEFVADDGARRGDGAAVLVVHTTAELARTCLDAPDAAVAPVIAALGELMSVEAPEWTHAHRWTFAKPAGPHLATFGVAHSDGRRIWLAGDQWCPQGAPRVESAWRSGTDLGEAIVAGRR